MMNLGLGQKVEGSHEKENGSESKKDSEDKIEGEGYTACHLHISSRRIICQLTLM